MNGPKVHDLTHFALALVLGIFGNVLLDGAEWGLNMSLWLLSTFGVVYYLRTQIHYSPIGKTAWAAYGFSLLFLWRDSPALQWLALVAIVAAVCFAPLGRREIPPTLMVYFGALVDAFASIRDLFRIRLPIAASSLRRKEVVRTLIVERILRGLLLSLIPVFVFGWLFIAADAIFENLVVEFFVFDPMELLHNLLIIFMLAAAACFVLYLLTVGPLSHIDQHEIKAPNGFGSVEINVVLSVINALFLVFVSVQIGYLFGGHDRVLDEAGPSYAEYAQRGFYELGAVAALAFSMLLALKAIMPANEPWAHRLFVVLSQLHILLVAVVVASGFHRMALYVEAYGLTVSRFYATAAILWLIVPLGGLSVALFRRRATFLPALLVRSAFVAVPILFAINPDALIAKTNIERASQGKRFDANYAASLSADALPVLIRGLRELPEADSNKLRGLLVERWSGEFPQEIREFSFARLLAKRSLDSLESQDLR